MHRVGVVLHPIRPVRRAVETLERWTADHGVELVDVHPSDSQAPLGSSTDPAALDLIVAVGGDGTVLSALHAAAKTGAPVLGVACGSLGALSSVPVVGLASTLDDIVAGNWWPRRVPALAVSTAGGHTLSAVNDLVLVRRGGSQLVVAVSVGQELYARTAGDGVVVATPTGSSAYSMASGGSLLLASTKAFVCTPLAMHGGCAPPLVVPADRTIALEVDPGHGGFDLEVDGHRVEPTTQRFHVRMEDGYATLVGLGEPESGLLGLRRRGLILDSPRVIVRDARSRAPGGDESGGS